MSEINANAVTGKVMGMMTEAAGDSERVDKSIDDTLGGGVKVAGGKAAKEAVKKIEDMVAEKKTAQAEESQQPDNGKKTKQETEKPAEKPEKKKEAKKDRDAKETGTRQRNRKNPAKDARTGTRRPAEKIKENLGERPGPGQTLKPPVKEIAPNKDNPLNPVRTGMKRPIDKIKETPFTKKDGKALRKKARDKAIDAKTKTEKTIDKAVTEAGKKAIDVAGKTTAVPTMGTSVVAAEAAKKGLDKAHELKSKAFDKLGEAEKKAGDMSDNLGKSVGDKISSMTKGKGMAIISGKGSAAKTITDILK